jgi:hypothetical protein
MWPTLTVCATGMSEGSYPHRGAKQEYWYVQCWLHVGARVFQVVVAGCTNAHSSLVKCLI